MQQQGRPDAAGGQAHVSKSKRNANNLHHETGNRVLGRRTTAVPAANNQRDMPDTPDDSADDSCLRERTQSR